MEINSPPALKGRRLVECRCPPALAVVNQLVGNQFEESKIVLCVRYIRSEGESSDECHLHESTAKLPEEKTSNR
jgi:hypothetical protein